MSTICTICARGGSKGVPNKNIKKMIGKPLIQYSIDQALRTNIFEVVVVSTDSEEIAEIALSAGAEAWFLRPKSLSGDHSAKIPVIKHALEMSEIKYHKEFSYLMDLDASSPLRSVKDIRQSYSAFLEGKFDNLITGSPSRRNPYFNMVEKNDDLVSLSKNIDPVPISRQSCPEVFDLNASIYIWKRDILLNSSKLITNNTGFFEMPENRSYDIDSELDWEVVEMIMKKKKNNDGV